MQPTADGKSCLSENLENLDSRCRDIVCTTEFPSDKTTSRVENVVCGLAHIFRCCARRRNEASVRSLTTNLCIFPCCATKTTKNKFLIHPNKEKLNNKHHGFRKQNTTTSECHVGILVRRRCRPRPQDSNHSQRHVAPHRVEIPKD